MIKLLHRDSWQERDITFHYKFSPQPASKLCTPQSDKQGANSSLHFQLYVNRLLYFMRTFIQEIVKLPSLILLLPQRQLHQPSHNKFFEATIQNFRLFAGFLIIFIFPACGVPLTPSLTHTTTPLLAPPKKP